MTQVTGEWKEEVAVIKIQTAFRGYMARRALRALRGLVRLKSVVQGTPVIRRTSNALRCMQTLARVQSQIQSRRIRMSEENQALQRQLLQKRAKELSLQIGEEWDDSLQSKEQIEANLLGKYEAAIRRERALAYSFSHQVMFIVFSSVWHSRKRFCIKEKNHVWTFSNFFCNHCN
ncbi:protein IQ-DOMAIN 1-like [Camellia sinensis]|uniref:protein IQ-DOMAIN 1-like n=1 Tax=Camellia sinensis TaxID=4442 RepID=UPI0010362F92|nr:protein IQ-DOMAIN 1-like [Camellia sinensis]